MPPKKQAQSRGNQRQSNQDRTKAISEYQDFSLYEKLSKDNSPIEDILDLIKDVDEMETKENVLQNFAQLIFKLVGLNSFILKLEEKSFSSIDSVFLKSEIEQNLKAVKDFNWVFTARKEEHKYLKDNLYIFFDSIISQNQYYETNEKGQSFMELLSKFLAMLSISNIQNVRQNVLRLVRIIVEQGLLRFEKLKAAEKRKLDKEEQFLKDSLEKVLTKLISSVFYSRAIDKSESIQQDCIDAFEICFNLSPQLALTPQNLIQLSLVCDTNIDLANSLLKVLVNVKWDESSTSKEALQLLIQNDKFRKRLIYFSNQSTYVTSYRAIKFINIVNEVLPGTISNKDLKRAMATIFHKYEEVRAEGLKIMYKFLDMKENEKKIAAINLDGDEDDGVNEIFSFKSQQSTQASMTFIKKLYTLLDEIDNKIYEKEELIQNLINSLGYEFGALFDFQSIFKLLNQLPSSNLKDKIYDLFKLIIVVLKRTMKFLSLIQSGERLSNTYNKPQSEKLLLIKNEFFQALLGNFDLLFENMNKNVIFKEYTYQIFLSIPAIDLQQNLKESQFKTISKHIAEDIFNTVLNQSDFIQETSQSLGLIFSCFSALQYFLSNTPRAYSDPFKVCKEKVIKHGILDSADTIHEVIVQGKETSIDYSEIQREYTFLFIKLKCCTTLLNQLDEIYCESFIQKCLEITDAATSSTSSDYTYQSLGLQLDFYLRVLRAGLSESSQKAQRLEDYLKYRHKVIKQLWLFLREEKKKAIQFNLEPLEYKRILFKSFSSTVEGLIFVSSQKLKHMRIYIKLQSDDPIFYAMIDYISYYLQKDEQENADPNNNNNNNFNPQDSSNLVSNQNKANNKKMVAEQEEQNGNNQRKLKPSDERILINQITDLQFILLQFCKLTLENPRFLQSKLGIYIFKNLYDCENKEIVDLLRKTLAAARVAGERTNGYPIFWKLFDEVIGELLDEGKDTNAVKKFAAFAHKAYFQEVVLEGGVSIKPKDQIKELCERQIYYLTARTGSLLGTPNKLNTLDVIGYMISLKITFPKSLDPDHLIAIQSLQKKYQTLFLKRAQDFVTEFKSNNSHLQSFDDTILSDKSKQIIYKYVKSLESWSSIKINVDPYGEQLEEKEEQNEEVKKSEKKSQKKHEDNDTNDEDNSADDEESDHENNEDSEEVSSSKKSKTRHSAKGSEKRSRSTRNSRGRSKGNKTKQTMEDENELVEKTAVRKTKKDRKQSSSSSVEKGKNKGQEDQKKVDTTKRNHRRQKR